MTAGDAATAELAEALAATYPDDAARVLERCVPAEVGALLCELDPEVAGEVLLLMSVASARAAIGALAAADAARLLAQLPAARAANVLRAASDERLAAVLAALPPRVGQALRRLLAQPVGTVAAVTDPEVLSITADADAAAALELMRAVAFSRDRVVVVDAGAHPLGVVGVAELVAAPPEARVEALMTAPAVTAELSDDVFALARHPGWSRWRTLPVVDRDGALVGVVRRDDIEKWNQEHRVEPQSPAVVAVELVELFWLGLAGITDGLARTVLEERRPPEASDG